MSASGRRLANDWSSGKAVVGRDHCLKRAIMGSTGFVYEIASGNAAQNGSISIETPRVYWEDRLERERE